MDNACVQRMRRISDDIRVWIRCVRCRLPVIDATTVEVQTARRLSAIERDFFLSYDMIAWTMYVIRLSRFLPLCLFVGFGYGYVLGLLNWEGS